MNPLPLPAQELLASHLLIRIFWVLDRPAQVALRAQHAGGLSAVFAPPPSAVDYNQAAQDTWTAALLDWLPQSEFEFDEARQEFEYHDKRDHGLYFGGKLQIDICIPIRQREEELRKAQLRSCC